MHLDCVHHLIDPESSTLTFALPPAPNGRRERKALMMAIAGDCLIQCNGALPIPQLRKAAKAGESISRIGGTAAADSEGWTPSPCLILFLVRPCVLVGIACLTTQGTQLQDADAAHKEAPKRSGAQQRKQAKAEENGGNINSQNDRRLLLLRSRHSAGQTRSRP